MYALCAFGAVKTEGLVRKFSCAINEFYSFIHPDMAKECVEVTKSESCELALNAVFYWGTMEFFKKRCDMSTLHFCLRQASRRWSLRVLFVHLIHLRK